MRSLDESLAGDEVAFVCVAAPSLPGGGPNPAFVECVGPGLVAIAKRGLVLVAKSTVAANTDLWLEQTIACEQHQIESSSAPPAMSRAERCARCRSPCWRQHDCPVIETDLAAAGLIKHASSAFLATRLSFVNVVVLVCADVGVDVRPSL
jgi:UDPglucose 6-dehydrogenase